MKHHAPNRAASAGVSFQREELAFGRAGEWPGGSVEVYGRCGSDPCQAGD